MFEGLGGVGGHMYSNLRSVLAWQRARHVGAGEGQFCEICRHAEWIVYTGASNAAAMLRKRFDGAFIYNTVFP